MLVYWRVDHFLLNETALLIVCRFCIFIFCILFPIEAYLPISNPAHCLDISAFQLILIPIVWIVKRFRNVNPRFIDTEKHGQLYCL